MKKIEVILKPYKLDDVKNGLIATGIRKFTISEVKGYDHDDVDAQEWSESVAYSPKVKLEIVVDDCNLDYVLVMVENHAQTGRSGDGKIFVSNIEEVVRIRTGERGTHAIQN